MRLTGTSVWLFCGVLLAVAPAALGGINIAGSNVGTSHTIVAGDVIDYGGFAVQVTDPGALTMTGGDVSSAGPTGVGVFMAGGSFDMTGGSLGGGSSTGSGLHIDGGAATIGGSATLRGGTDSVGTGTGMNIRGGTVTVNSGTFYAGGSTGAAFDISGGQIDVFGGDFHGAVSNPGSGSSAAASGGEINFYGGNILYGFTVRWEAEVNIFNGQFGDDIRMSGGTTTIHGSVFSVDSVPVTTPLPFLVTGDTPTVDVTYLNGLTETITFNRSQDRGTLILAPEPATLIWLAAGLPLMLKRKRKSR